MSDWKPNKSTVGLRLPRSSGITEQHLYSAFIYGSTHQQRRIKQWGRMQKRILRNIGRDSKHDGTQLPK
jgi:hypothetical protein